MPSQPLVIVLLGATASGKTALSLEIAERLAVPVINVDSRQLYCEMDIGTAKPLGFLIFPRFQHCFSTGGMSGNGSVTS